MYDHGKFTAPDSRVEPRREAVAFNCPIEEYAREITMRISPTTENWVGSP
jgi:hypothetical protein